MIVDLKAFCADIEKAEHEKCVDDVEVLPYLMRNLFAPYMRGEIVTLDSLDYNAFDLEDLDALFRYADDAGYAGDVLGRMYSTLHRCVPAARKRRAFC